MRELPAMFYRHPVVLLLLPLMVLAQEIEPRQPLSAAQELRVTQDQNSVIVSGETFRYTIRKDNGLIGEIQVLGRTVTDGTPVPDLMVAEQLDPAVSPYLARHETKASVAFAASDPARVVIHAEGAYTSRSGDHFPLRYSIVYDIGTDGVVLVSVKNTADGDCSFRWLLLSAGAIRSSMARFLNWMPEQSTSQTSHYRFRALDGQSGADLLTGVWIPWIWLGDQQVGLEVTTWDVSDQTFNQIDSTARKDESAMFVVRRQDAGVRWENFLVRRSRVFAGPGWSLSGEFALAVTPSKRFDPYFALIKGAHLGPHQHVQKFNLPTEEEIRTLAQNGVDLIVGMANWRSGEYVPLNEADLRRTIDLCHRYGVKIIPYITLVDLSHATDAFRQRGEEWAIEPRTEFIHHLRPNQLQAELSYRNDAEEETTLMCPGSAGWRAHWKQQIGRVIRDYDFDGIYFDMWFERMVCENARHGCGGRFRKATVLGSREMLMYAYNRLKAKNPHAIIKVNTNTLATALITSLVDIRLVGEAIDPASMDADSRQWLYSSYGLGEPTEFLWTGRSWTQGQRASFAALVNFLPKYLNRPKAVPRQAFDDFDVFRSFDDGTGSWSLGISDQARLKASPPEVAVNLVERKGSALATLINTSGKAVTAELPVGKTQRAYEPLSDRLLDTSKGAVRVDLAPAAYRHIVLWEDSPEPRVLAALGAGSPASEVLDRRDGSLRITVDAAPGAPVRYTVVSRREVSKVTNSHGEPVPFKSADGLTRFETKHIPGDSVTVFFRGL